MSDSNFGKRPGAPSRRSMMSMIASAVDLSMLTRTFQQLIYADPALYYESLGHDVVEGAARNGQEHGTLWQNCGDWSNASTYTSACEALAHRVGVLAELDSAEMVLDVGFGFGEQNLYWSRCFAFRHMCGVNITPFQVQFAQSRVDSVGLSNRVTFQVGNAVRLAATDASVDRVIALQSAFQFNTRNAFFDESARVLRPDGVLVLADMIPSNDARSWNPWASFTRRRVGWPSANLYTASRYATLLEAAGFQEITITSIAAQVFPGMQQYIARRFAGEASSDIVIYPEDMETLDVAARLWRFHYGIDDYVLVRAVRKHND
jgi:microcystin synthetase protein McyJ